MATMVRGGKRETKPGRKPGQLSPLVRGGKQESLMDKLQRLLEQKGWNSEQLAKHSRMPEGTVRKLVYGERTDPRLSTLRLLAAGLGVDTAYLVD